MTLEDIMEIFNHEFGVKYARELQKEARMKHKMVQGSA